MQSDLIPCGCGCGTFFEARDSRGRPRRFIPGHNMTAKQILTCVIEGCGKPHQARGWCAMHYARWRDHGDPLHEYVIPTCSVKGCEGANEARGLCRLHYDRWRKNGTLEIKFHGYTGSPTYKSWQGMKTRCYATTHIAYKHYGGRGITVCDRWLNSFENFLADMGIRPDGKTLDRWPNNDGNYEPGNCRWATPKEQANNRRQHLSGLLIEEAW